MQEIKNYHVASVYTYIYDANDILREKINRFENECKQYEPDAYEAIKGTIEKLKELNETIAEVLDEVC